MTIQTHGRPEICGNLVSVVLRGLRRGYKNTLILMVFTAFSCLVPTMAIGQQAKSNSDARYVLGPFKNLTEVQKLVPLLEENDLPFVRREQVEPGSLGFIVVSRRFETKHEANDLVRSLRESNINDTTYVQVGPYQGRVSTGVFLTRRVAIGRQVQLAKLGFKTEVIPRDGVRNTWWLDIDVSLIEESVLRQIRNRTGDQVSMTVDGEVVADDTESAFFAEPEEVYEETSTDLDEIYTETPAEADEIYTETPSEADELYAETPAEADEIYTETPSEADELYAETPTEADEEVRQTFTPETVAPEEPKRPVPIASVTTPDHAAPDVTSGNLIYYGLAALLGFLALAGFMLYRMRNLQKRILSPPMQALIGSALDSRVEGVLVMDEMQTIVFANQSLQNIVELSGDELTGNRAYVLKSAGVNGKLLGDAETPWGQALIKGVPQMNLRVRLKAASSKYGVFLTNSSPLIEDTGKAVGVLVSFNHIEALDDEGESLESPELTKGEASARHADLLAQLNPDIQTSMNAILGYAEVLRRGFGIESEESRKYIDAISTGSDQAVTLINDIIELSRIETGRAQVEAASFSPEFLVNDVVNLMETRVEGKGISVVTEVESALPTRIVSDPGMIRRILTNLVGNAIDCSGKDDITVVPEIVPGIVPDIADGQSDAIFTLTVHGAGSSLAEDEVTSLLELMEKEINTGQVQGKGLGLSIYKRIAKTMGGDVLIRREPGRGLVFEASMEVRIDEDLQTQEALALLADAEGNEEKVADAEARVVQEDIARLEAEETVKVEVKAREEAEAQLNAEAAERQAAQARIEEEIAARIAIEASHKSEADARAEAEEKAETEATARTKAEALANEEAEARKVAESKVKTITKAHKTITQAHKEAEERIEQENKARIEEEADKRAEAERKLEEEASKRAEAERKLEEEASKRAEAEREAEEEASKRAEAESRVEEEAGKRAEAERKAEDEAQARAATDADSATDERVAAEAEARSRAEAKLEEETRLRVAAEQKAELALQAQANAEARATAETNARLKAEERAKTEEPAGIAIEEEAAAEEETVEELAEEEAPAEEVVEEEAPADEAVEEAAEEETPAEEAPAEETPAVEADAPTVVEQETEETGEAEEIESELVDEGEVVPAVDQEQSKQTVQSPQVGRFVIRLAKLLETMEAGWEAQQLSEYPRICRWISKNAIELEYTELAGFADELIEAVEREESSKIPEKLRAIRGYYLTLDSETKAADLTESEPTKESSPVAAAVDVPQATLAPPRSRAARWPIKSNLNVDNPTIQKLVKKSVARLESQLFSMDAAFEAENYADLAKLCVEVRGEADSVKLLPLIQPTKDLEEMVKSGQVNRAKESLAFLKDLFSRIDLGPDSSAEDQQEGAAANQEVEADVATETDTESISEPVRSHLTIENPKLKGQIEKFIIGLGSRLTELHHALDNDDLAEVGRISQWILRYSRVLGFDDFTRPARELSEIADDGAKDLIPDKLDELGLLFARIED